MERVHQTKRLAIRALSEALKRLDPETETDHMGYTSSFRDNLVPCVHPDDFEADLRQGDGNELEGKFRAAHSSSALAVNSFGPFRRHIADLSLLGAEPFQYLHFERKCPTGLRGTAPNLDVLLEGSTALSASSRNSRSTWVSTGHASRRLIRRRSRMSGGANLGSPRWSALWRILGDTAGWMRPSWSNTPSASPIPIRDRR